MSRKTLILFVWLIIGAAAAGQRGDFSDMPSTCSSGATIAATIAIGPLNYLGVNPQIPATGPRPPVKLSLRAPGASGRARRYDSV